MSGRELTALILTNEFPPAVYGGAGIHVTELSRELGRRVAIDIRTFGDQQEVEPGRRVRGYA
ncbi:MAG: glycogen synthase, partial [Candidatus Limnocylindria bacterium]